VPLEAVTVVGSYRVDGILGRGGMAVVYSARHVELGREVALKVLAAELGSDPEFVARFRREGRLQASLEHPHVVTVYEAGESEHGLYLAMRLVRGSTLAELMRERALDASRALGLLRQVGDALDAAHAAGLVHRDVKPQNVLVGDADDAYLGDFGLTRAGGTAGITATGRLVGTISYLAPEVIRGDEAVPASDRYAFAAMVFECLTGTVVFPRRTEAATLYAHSSEPPPRISQRRPELPQVLDGLFARELSKNPDERSHSARGFVDAVGGLLEGAGVGSLGLPPAPGDGGAERYDGGAFASPPAGATGRTRLATDGAVARRRSRRGCSGGGGDSGRGGRWRWLRDRRRLSTARWSRGARQRPGGAGARARLPRAGTAAELSSLHGHAGRAAREDAGRA